MFYNVYLYFIKHLVNHFNLLPAFNRDINRVIPILLLLFVAYLIFIFSLAVLRHVL